MMRKLLWLLAGTILLLSTACGGDEKSQENYATLAGHSEPASQERVALQPMATVQQTLTAHAGRNILVGVLKIQNATISELQKNELAARLQQMIDAGTDSNLQIAMALAANPQIRRTVTGSNAALELAKRVEEVKDELADQGGGGTGGGSTGTSSYALPDTGQKTCYDSAAMAINCASTGQDGEFSINPMSFTDISNGTVRDNVTGLIWQQNDDSTTRTWHGALDYCNGLTLGDSSNWRLPTRRELMYIADYERHSPAIDPVFNAKSSEYWSALPLARLENDAWYVDFNYGDVSTNTKSADVYVRCVQGDLQPEPEYTDNGNSTVTDQSTGLIWQQNDDGTTRTWNGALDYCNGLTLGDSSNWRLPNIKELESIVDISTFIPASNSAFNAKSSFYWSATSDAISPNGAWYIDFYDGYVSINNKTLDSYYVRCVR